LTSGSANDSFFKVGNYDVKEDKTPPPQKKINAYFTTAGLAPPTDSHITSIAKEHRVLPQDEKLDQLQNNTKYCAVPAWLWKKTVAA